MVLEGVAQILEDFKCYCYDGMILLRLLHDSLGDFGDGRVEVGLLYWMLSVGWGCSILFSLLRTMFMALVLLWSWLEKIFLWIVIRFIICITKCGYSHK